MQNFEKIEIIPKLAKCSKVNIINRLSLFLTNTCELHYVEIMKTGIILLPWVLDEIYLANTN